ncbi:MAG: substrate-binding domain-containing protein [Thermodesulfobacteriota bacterium]
MTNKVLLGLIVILFVSTSVASANDFGTKVLRVTGSDNVARFVSVYAKDYMAEHPGSSIIVVGGRTATGVRDLFEGRAELAMASRRLGPSEYEKAEQNGMKVAEKQVGWCSIVVVTHPSNPVNELTKAQVAGIFKGEYSNWNAVGGPDRPIKVIAVEDKHSDPVVFLKENLLGGQPYTRDATVVSAITTVLPKVLETEGSIGFCRVTDLEYRERRDSIAGHSASQGGGHGIAPKSLPKVLAIRESSGTPAITPPTSHKNHASVAAHAVDSSPYPVRYPLYIYLSGNAAGPLTKEFADYCAKRGMGRMMSTGH